MCARTTGSSMLPLPTCPTGIVRRDGDGLPRCGPRRVRPRVRGNIQAAPARRRCGRSRRKRLLRARLGCGTVRSLRFQAGRRKDLARLEPRAERAMDGGARRPGGSSMLPKGSRAAPVRGRKRPAWRGWPPCTLVGGTKAIGLAEAERTWSAIVSRKPGGDYSEYLFRAWLDAVSGANRKEEPKPARFRRKSQIPSCDGGSRTSPVPTSLARSPCAR
jgi:hypothetical protein